MSKGVLSPQYLTLQEEQTPSSARILHSNNFGGETFRSSGRDIFSPSLTSGRRLTIADTSISVNDNKIKNSNVVVQERRNGTLKIKHKTYALTQRRGDDF